MYQAPPTPHRRVRPPTRVLILSLLCAVTLAGCGDSADKKVASARQHIAAQDYRTAIIELKSALEKADKNTEARLLFARALLESGDPLGAEREARKALAQGAAADAAMPILARGLMQAGDFRKAIAELKPHVPTDPKLNAVREALLGDGYVGVGKPDDAATAYAAALALDPTLASAHLGQARLAALKGDTAAAMATVDKLLASTPDAAEALSLKAELLIAGNQRDQARAIYERLVKLSPQDVKARGNLLMLMIAAGQHEAAKKELDAMDKAAGVTLHGLYLRALLADHANDPNAARTAVQQVLKAAPEHLPSLLLAGMVEFKLKNHGTAQQHLKKLLEKMPGNVVARRLLAASLLASAQPARALEAIQPLLKSDADADTLALAGQIYLAGSDTAKGLALIEKAATMEPQDAAKRTGLALTRLQTGDTEHAMRDFEAARAIDPKDTRADLALISAHLRAREADKALQAIKVLEQKRPDSPLPHNLRATAFMLKSDWESARRSFERALEIKPDYFPAAANLAQLDARDKKFDAAKSRFESLLKHDPKNADARIALAELTVLAGGKPDQAIPFLEQAVSDQPQNPRARLALIEFHLRARHNDKALAAAQQAAAALPDRPEILEAVGKTQLAANNAAQAKATFLKLAELVPTSATPLVLQANALGALGDLNGAQATLEKALKLEPKRLDVKRTLITFLIGARKFDDALRLAKEVSRDQPKEPLGPVFEGDILMTQSKWTEAAGAYREGMSRKSTPELVTKLHAALARAGKETEAETVLQGWLKQHPDDAGVRGYRANHALARKDFKAAEEQYRALLETHPDRPMILNNLAWVMGQRGERKALEYAEKAVEMRPDHPALLDTLGTLLVQFGDEKRGLEVLQKAINGAPNEPGIKLNFAKALIKTGRKDVARKELDVLSKPEMPEAVRKEAGELIKTL